MKIGFTGTRYGMTLAQKRQLRYMLSIFKHADQAVGRTPEFHYGTHETARLWSDEQAAEIAKEMGYTLVPHHALNGQELERDEEEAEACHVMIAAPLHDKEEMRSGTWTTVRYTRRRTKPVVQLARG